jgi:hypothetical protein
MTHPAIHNPSPDIGFILFPYDEQLGCIINEYPLAGLKALCVTFTLPRSHGAVRVERAVTNDIFPVPTSGIFITSRSAPHIAPASHSSFGSQTYLPPQ